MMGAGKTSVGRLLSAHLGYAFVDLDAEIERHAGTSIAEIFRQSGEQGFRSLEAAITEETGLVGPTVVAVGGGWMARSELRDRWPGAVRVWLEVSPEVALERLGQERGSRPLLVGDEARRRAEELLDERLPAYAMSEYRVHTDGLDPEEVVKRIVDLLGPGASAEGTTS